MTKMRVLFGCALLACLALRAVFSPQTPLDSFANASTNAAAIEGAGGAGAEVVPKVNVSFPTLTLPNLLFIGAQKAGSSAVASWLLQDGNGVCGGQPMDGEPPYTTKELKFFDREQRYKKGYKFYMDHYKHCFQVQGDTDKPKPIHGWIMDGTPDTIRYFDRVKKTYQKHPEMLDQLRLVVSLRDPIDRELSMYNHILKRQIKGDLDYGPSLALGSPANRTWMGFTEFVLKYTLPTLYTNDISSVNHYARYLKQFFEWIPRERILVLNYHTDVKTGHAKKRLRDFLAPYTNLPFQPDGPFQKANENSSPLKVSLVPCSAVRVMRNHTDAFNNELYKLMEEYPGPTMEEKPFVPFQIPICDETK